MNRIALESIGGGRRASVGSQLQHQYRGGGKFTGGGGDAGDDGLDLFSRTRRSDGGGGLISSNSNRSDGGEPIKLERISLGSTRIGKGMEDLLDAEIGKHDYDWLLTPPETPLYPSVVARESPLSSTTRESPLSSTTRESPVSSVAPRGRATARSVSNTRPSRLSASQTENGHSTRPVRSSSVTRSSISSTYSSTSFSNNNNRTSVLNTSSASVTSSRPSTPGTRCSRPSSTSRPLSISTTTRPSSTSTTATRPSSSSTTARPSLSSTTTRPSSTSRSVPSSRMPTPTRTRPNPIPSSDRMTRPSNNSRPSTPTSRPQTPSNPNLNPRANSRPSTPTRRPTSSAGASTSNSSRFPPVGRISSANTRNPTAPTSRPSSPGPRPRAPVRPIDLPDFPSDAPPNLRTKLPERPVSAGRTRPGMALTVRSSSNLDAAVPAVAAPATSSSNRRNYMPVVSTRSKFPENPPKVTSKLLGGNNGHEAGGVPEIHKLASSDGGLRRPTKPSSTAESTGFGRTISKKSLDMALRHMDIRQGMGGIRVSPLFPQSIRSSTTGTKGRPARKSDPVVPLSNDEAMAEIRSYNGTISPDCRSRSSIAPSENGGDFTITSKSPDRDSLATRESELDLHGSSHYDAFMLKEEDSKNMNWLHSAEDKSDQSPVFDHRFEPLPEPFGLL